jgi:hypothetical protein
VNAPLCSNAGRDASDVFTKLSSADAVHATLAHGLFHAAQAALAGNYANNWFYEATATWAETRFGYSDPRGYSTTVTDNAKLPMDSFKPAIDGAKEHEYGAWTFVAWLFSRGKIDWTTLRQIFVASAHSPTTPILDDQLKAAGTSFGNEVASFWADHTNPVPQFGPKTKVAPDVISAETDQFKTKLAPYLGGRVGALKLGAKRQQLVVILPKVPPGVQIWLNLGNKHFLQLDEGESLNDTFCRGLTTNGSYALPSNGELPIAITSTSPSAPETLTLKLITSSDPCPKPLLIEPGLAIGPLHLGMSLPAADQAVPKRTKLIGPVHLPAGTFTSAVYSEAPGAAVIADFLNGRIAYMLVEGNRFATKDGITGLKGHNIFNDRPELGPTFIPGSTLGDFGGEGCRNLGGHPAERYCWKTGPPGRYTLAVALQENPCPNDPDGDQDNDIDVPPCTFPVDDYIFGLSVATHKGFKLAQMLIEQQKPSSRDGA